MIVGALRRGPERACGGTETSSFFGAFLETTFDQPLSVNASHIWIKISSTF